VLLLAGPVAAEPRRLVFPTLLGEYTLAFDSARIAEPELRALAVLSPHLAGWTSLAVAPRLEHCVVDDPDYLDCGSRTPGAPNFVWNARVNLRRGAAALAALDRLAAPPELAPVVTWLKRSLRFSLWLEESRLEFYATGRLDALGRRYEDVDPARTCREALAAVAATDGAERDDLVAHRWHNCVNTAYRARLGEYPRAAWDAFLAAYGVGERSAETLTAPVRR
jgi:hypothetical protein